MMNDNRILAYRSVKDLRNHTSVENLQPGLSEQVYQHPRRKSTGDHSPPFNEALQSTNLAYNSRNQASDNGRNDRISNPHIRFNDINDTNARSFNYNSGINYSKGRRSTRSQNQQQKRLSSFSNTKYNQPLHSSLGNNFSQPLNFPSQTFPRPPRAPRRSSNDSAVIFNPTYYKPPISPFPYDELLTYDPNSLNLFTPSYGAQNFVYHHTTGILVDDMDQSCKNEMIPSDHHQDRHLSFSSPSNSYHLLQSSQTAMLQPSTSMEECFLYQNPFVAAWGNYPHNAPWAPQWMPNVGQYDLELNTPKPAPEISSQTVDTSPCADQGNSVDIAFT
ncbi:hypothetical protein BCR41DRAFT_126529 [Lobosporangium transversale]|uniref:Uncharacterized protein n=1 Tax=Lobosporangium transversale TaxID=64571 RepID=A0A1Y2H0H2_9FUNG|nr:hypothetical protein BCR41DRAFT_126529 [Lobosporangium transversale]ORZ28015.1 hypothetical protein BCR41DRAFT_126529 [Lobosporangium transversale]|eukprot:XP_021885718.1 hypothetical protein BCR41DRAFT_126529 [Lobosporangium transversale]